MRRANITGALVDVEASHRKARRTSTRISDETGEALVRRLRTFRDMAPTYSRWTRPIARPCRHLWRSLAKTGNMPASRPDPLPCSIRHSCDGRSRLCWRLCRSPNGPLRLTVFETSIPKRWFRASRRGAGLIRSEVTVRRPRSAVRRRRAIHSAEPCRIRYVSTREDGTDADPHGRPGRS